MDLNGRDIAEYTAFAVGVIYSTFKEVSSYLLYDFPITQINQWIYALVLLTTLAIAMKRIWGWFFKSNKNESKS